MRFSPILRVPLPLVLLPPSFSLPRKSILRNARSDVNSQTNANVDETDGRWTSKVSSRISDLRMRSISSDPRLSVTSYGKNEEDRIVRNTASFPALMHLIRAFICCGFLSLPYAVKVGFFT